MLNLIIGKILSAALSWAARLFALFRENEALGEKQEARLSQAEIVEHLRRELLEKNSDPSVPREEIERLKEELRVEARKLIRL